MNRSPTEKTSRSLLLRQRTRFQALLVVTRYGYVFVALKRKIFYPASYFAHLNGLFTAFQLSRRKLPYLNLKVSSLPALYVFSKFISPLLNLIVRALQYVLEVLIPRCTRPRCTSFLRKAELTLNLQYRTVYYMCIPRSKRSPSGRFCTSLRRARVGKARSRRHLESKA